MTKEVLDDPVLPGGTVTLRSALATATTGQTITFNPALDGGTINLLIVGGAAYQHSGEQRQQQVARPVDG